MRVCDGTENEKESTMFVRRLSTKLRRERRSSARYRLLVARRTGRVRSFGFSVAAAVSTGVGRAARAESRVTEY